MKTQSTIYIHIGIEKTGTTSLQDFFLSNKESLEEYYNLYYPQSPGLKNHINLSLYGYSKNIKDLLLQKNFTQTDKIEQFRLIFKEAFEKELLPKIADGKDILISNEHLSSRFEDKGEVENFITLFENVPAKIKVITYLRRQDSFLTSTYSTAVKGGATKQFEIGNYRGKRYNLLFTLDTWASVVGQENMIVGIFEKGYWTEGNLYKDFCSKLGIQDFSNLAITNKQSNVSLDVDSLCFLTHFNKHVPLFVRKGRNMLRGDIVRILEEKVDGESLRLTDVDLQQIRSNFYDQNQEIVSKYLPSAKEYLLGFPDKSDIAKQSQNHISIERAIELSSILYREQQSRINRLRKRWKAQELEIEKLKTELKELKGKRSLET